MLRFMIEETPSGYEHGWFFPIKYISKALVWDFPICRGFLHSMRMRGLVEFGHGFNDDGQTAGSGYTFTPAGKTHYRNLAEKSRADRIAARNMVSRGEQASWGSTSYQ